jgi:hypothetical protein
MMRLIRRVAQRVSRRAKREGRDPRGSTARGALKAPSWAVVSLCLLTLIAVAASNARTRGQSGGGGTNFDTVINNNAQQLLADGRRVFRFETFGDEAFWGDTLKLHQAIQTVTPTQALALGLKVDADALKTPVDLNSPSGTLSLLKQNAVVGVTGFFDTSGTSLTSIGLQCAVCHSTVDNSVSFGIGHRLDGWANRDLNVGAIVALAPGVHAITQRLQVVDRDITDSEVRAVLNSWGPGKFDAELLLDGKAFNPRQITNGKVTGTMVPGATLIPNAFGLAGFNQHTWTGAWGTVTYWNALVANLEMGGVGRFFDPRLNNRAQFPIAAHFGLGNVTRAPDDDRVTKGLAALHFYQLAIPAPTPVPGKDFDNDAALRGDKLFEGKAQCNTCHVEPLWTEPGWNLHTPEEMKIDAFQAKRAPVGAIRPNGHVDLHEGSYKTMNLAGIFVRENGLFMAPGNKGRYYHDGRFKTLMDVVRSYNDRFNLHLTPGEMGDVVEYLKSLVSNGSAEVGG